ncbi:SRPBCC family protein [Neobacillus drentensis]|uniref:SRPBCC family protein n=1 Tax=Neobacillus drentensis TaxID=220684 RepID=UPI003002290C
MTTNSSPVGKYHQSDKGGTKMLESNATNNTVTSIEGRELVVSRIFDAPRELVYKTWTDPEHLPHWWGPKGFTITVQEIDVKPGGVWRYVMHGPDGVDYDNYIEYIEVVSPEKLVYSHGGGDDEPFHVTVMFEDEGNKTALNMRTRFKSAEELDKVVKQYGAIEGAKSTLDRLEEQLAKI